MTITESKLEISKDIFDKCVKFANDSASTSTDKYARRSQFDPIKIMKDIRNGKIAEEMVYATVVEQYPQLSKPDFNIYSKKDKSWDPDLKDTDSKLRIAVKSQDVESALHFGESWVFQFGNGRKYDCDTGIFGKTIDPNHYVSFVLLNVAKKQATLRAIVKVQWLHDKKLFKAMQKKNLQGNKMAVYYEDLMKYSDELWQL